MQYVTGLILLLFGLVTMGGGQIGIQATPNSEISWITVFAALPNWTGWVLIWFGIDSFFDGKLTKVLFSRVLSPILDPIVKSMVGEERLEKFRARLGGGGESGVRKWVGKTYKGVIDEDAMDDLVRLCSLKLESPELFDFFYREAADRIRHRGITIEMVEATIKCVE